MKSDEVKEEKKKHGGFIKKILLVFLIIILVLLFVKFIFKGKDGQIVLKVKTSLEKIVEKSELETVDITYNVIAKKCKNNDDCDMSSNDINDFKYVVSCKGTITAGIDFKEVKVTVDDVKKQIVVEMPDATIKGEPNIGSIKFLNGNEVPADELPNARVLCQQTVMDKSKKDNKLIPSAKEQARVVLEEFYKKWIKAYDSSYEVVVR